MISKFAIYKTDIGFISIGYEMDTIKYIQRLPKEPTQNGIRTPLTDEVYKQITEYFIGRRKTFDFPYQLEGTPFQQKVWKALCAIPYGETCTYKEIAEAIGNPKASRAVGMANHKNPLLIVVPCHRVIGTNGKLIGYLGGIELKSLLLDIEKKNKDK